MSKTKKKNELNLVRSVNKNVRSSTRKLKPILKALVGKKVDFALRDLEFSNKRICGDVKKLLPPQLLMPKIIINTIQINL